MQFLKIIFHFNISLIDGDKVLQHFDLWRKTFLYVYHFLPIFSFWPFACVHVRDQASDGGKLLSDKNQTDTFT